ncbi:hypothetical protein INR49_032175 [Caranx melampygus]|nr:hypothetical protein INR49_032175 [Caranx melampygus]
MLLRGANSRQEAVLGDVLVLACWLVLVHLGAVLAPSVQTLLVLLLLTRASRYALTVRLGKTEAGHAWGLLGKVKRLLLAEVGEEAHLSGQAESSPLPKH